MTTSNGSNRRRPIAAALALLTVALGACATSRTLAVSPAEIPALEQRIAVNPNDGEAVVRYAAALFAADDCQAATPVGERAILLRPRDVTGPLVVGQCLERGGSFEEALSLYSQFEQAYGDTPSGDLLRARASSVTRMVARARARAAIAMEDSLAAGELDPDAMGVLPLVVEGTPDVQSLSLGLANMITSDLALVGRFRLVERLELGAIVDELQLSRTGRVAPETALRVGRFTRAGRMLQGVMAGGPEEATSLTADISLSTGEILQADPQRGPFEDLLRLEKQLVLDIVDRLGYELTPTERQRVLENGTGSLIAFLAYSRGLLAEEMGDYDAAAQHFQEATRADPGFQEAGRRLGTVVASSVALNAPPADVPVLVQQTTEALASVGSVVVGTGFIDALSGSLLTSIGDIAGMQAERINLPGGRELGQLTRPAETPPITFRAVIRISIPIGE
jgi:tetratricopeptide (TPR) repeat protein